MCGFDCLQLVIIMDVLYKRYMNLLDKNKIDNGSDMLMKKRFVLR